MTDNRSKFKNIAVAVARLADAKKAEEVAIYDMAGRSDLVDFVVVVTVDNPAQMDAVDDEISINLKQEGLYALYRDGMKSKSWKVLDYGGILVHIFEKKTREFYSFDKVYSGYNAVKWQEKAAAGGAAVPGPRAAGGRKPAPKKAKAAAKKTGAPRKKAGAKLKTVKKTAVKRTAGKKTAARKPVKKVAARKPAPKKKKR